MAREQRRSPRVEVSLPVRITIRDRGDDRTLAESTGRINDISRHGLRLTVPQPKIDQWHIFYNFQENNQQMLLLEVFAGQADEQVSDFKLPVIPVWFDRLLSLPDKPFQVGMEFTEPPPNEVVTWLSGKLNKLRSRQKVPWWSRLFGGR
ncbi:PilZ domain-containing protein [Desulfurivibrio dismutans]|uniref:PilZ domain-containing protein n=1 Tax=Desulfurivibrio dismutans TaxID=1398908 RepID=UPI0023DB5082|nr:PilZ domain-containing protein [Desulfurivibrio alkaliphilus]MDF1615034.1 PilZ domain-containing protein [Desulfurivibrio alkaliphilus]